MTLSGDEKSSQRLLLTRANEQEKVTYPKRLKIQSTPLNSDTLVPLTFGRIKRRNGFVRIKRKINCSFHGHA
ncbi:unnamed protein product [Clavelina lepadiformis]|uniref:Uncharacterized protein n=1 Tax=Clavelina lepadiformis TaxID=159417 RepID=A0ABP0H1A9_CLALP